MSIVLQALTKVYQTDGEPVVALQDVHTAIREDSITMVVGKSGCGKTTLLRLLGGMEEPTSGSIVFPELPCVGFVFQEPRLMPWLSVRENITFASKHKEAGLFLSEQQVEELLQVLGLDKFAGLYPCELSGGMAQRTALGRTLYQNPQLLLMDEPFSALDYFTRRGLQQTLLDLYRKDKKTVVFVTHDVDEALLLGQNILLLNHGTLVKEISVPWAYPRDMGMRELQELHREILTAIENS